MIRSVRLITIGLGLAAAGGVAVWQTGWGNGGEAARRTVAMGKGLGARAEARRMDSEIGKPFRPTVGFSREIQAVRGDDGVSDSRLRGRLTAAERQRFFDGPFVPTREELAWRAVIVEQEAHHGLKSLIGVLNLTDGQQDRLFAALAKESEYYHPALQIHGGTGGEPWPGVPATSPAPPSDPPNPADPADSPPSETPKPGDLAEADPVVGVLTPDQIEVYERYTSERDEFWSGVVQEIEAELSNSGE